VALTLAGEPRQPVQLIQLGDSQAVLCGALGADMLCAQHRVGEVRSRPQLPPQTPHGDAIRCDAHRSLCDATGK
jgi:hypothetical protein